MTIISAVVGDECIAVASDSYRTELADLDDRRFVVVEENLPKIVAVNGPTYRGAISWFGYHGFGEENLPWFQQRAGNAAQHQTAEEFATFITSELNTHFVDELGMRPRIGLHFAVYEQVENDEIPELFYIHNVDGNYDRTANLVLCQRHSRFISSGETVPPDPSHREPEHRKAVLQHLRSVGPLVFNNPNPKLFGPLATLFWNQNRARYRMDPASVSLEVAAAPISFVVHILKHGALAESYDIGGTVHCLVLPRKGGDSWHKFSSS